LLWWAVQSLHELISSGLIEKSDIKIAIQKSQFDFFKADESLKTYFGELDPFIEIPINTSGPAETASIALNALREKKQAIETESLVISDCDHFVKSIELVRNLNRSGDVFVREAKKDESLAWCFLDLKSNPPKLIEKPKSTDSIDVSRGIIGMYGFKTIKSFLESSFNLLKEKSEQEVYISAVVNEILAQGGKLQKSEVQTFFPMGNLNQLESIKSLPDPSYLILDSPTRFIDIDGIVVLHNHEIWGKPTNTSSEVPLNENIQLINKEYLSSRIILTTARPSSNYEHLTKSLNTFGVLYDQLILNCTGGVRSIYNDLKPNRLFIWTAKSFNLIRNTEIHFEPEEVVVADISGGSGAKTLVIEQEELLVVKIETNSKNFRRLQYQKNWFEYCSRLKLSVPEIIDFRSTGDKVCWLKTKYVPNLINFSSYIDAKNDSVNSLNILRNEFEILYSQTSVNGVESKTLMREIIEEKVIPSIRGSISKNSLHETVVNELTILETSIKKFLNSRNFQLYQFKGLMAPIHGDPTFENLQIDQKNGKLYLFDPIGKMIEPNYDFSSFDAFSYPVFDLARIELSYRFNYEKYNFYFKNTSEQVNLGGIVGTLHGAKVGPSILSTHFKSVFHKFNVENLELVIVTTIARILKYKNNPLEVEFWAKTANELLKKID
jgi:hypothetical protein